MGYRLLSSYGLIGFSSAILLLVTQPSQAYVQTVNVNGLNVRWRAPVKVNFAGNPRNQSGLSNEDFYTAVIAGLQRWKSASSNAINFDFWQGEDSSIYPANSDLNGLSSIYFISNSKKSGPLPQNVLGMTQVWYKSDTGEIIETDISLNDKDFRFTNDPRDTSGYGAPSSKTTNGKSNVYIQNVITHELGHALGLSHSGGLQSTMLFMESPEQAHLGCDEMIAIHSLYPTSDANIRSNLEGRVVSERNQPIFGAHVLAISQSRGLVLASAVTNKEGRYRISALEPGNYYLMAEPFFAGSQALPSFFAGMNLFVCPKENPFSRSFLTTQDRSNLIPVSTSTSQVTTAPDLIAHCDDANGATVLENPLTRVLEKAPPIDLVNTPTQSFAFADKINKSYMNYYKLQNISGNIKINAIAYSVYSPFEPKLELLTTSGTRVNEHILSPVYEGESGYVNHDSELNASDLPAGDYLLRISGKPLQANHYPAGPVALDSTAFVIITGSIGSITPAMGDSIPQNGRCSIRDNFPNYTSPPGPPIRSSFSDDSDTTGSCGPSSSPKQNQQFKDIQNLHMGATSVARLIGWFIPWILIFLELVFFKLRHRISFQKNPL